MKLSKVLSEYRKKAREYAKIAAKRVKYEVDLDLAFNERYLEFRKQEKTTENEARAKAKLALAERYARLAEMKAEEKLAEAELDIMNKVFRVAVLLKEKEVED